MGTGDLPGQWLRRGCVCLQSLRLNPLGEGEATTSYWTKNNLIEWFSVKTDLTRVGLKQDRMGSREAKGLAGRAEMLFTTSVAVA